MRAIAAWLAVAAVVAGTAVAQDEAPAPEGSEADQSGPTIPGGFTSGRKYVDMTGREKAAYVSGLMDGMLLAPAFGGNVDRMEWFLACTEAVGVSDMRGAINDYMFEHTDDWDTRNPAKYYRAIVGRCRAHFEEVKQGAE